MSDERGRVQISGFDPDRVESHDGVSGWTTERTASPESRWQRGWRRFKQNRTALVGVAVVSMLVFVAVFARPITVSGITVQPFSLAPWDPNTIHYFDPEGSGAGVYDPPSREHPMGTDNSGRDLLSRVMVGGRYSISLGFIVVGITATIGSIYGGISGYYGGWVDEVMMRIVDTIFAFPALILYLIIVAILGSGYWQMVVAFSVVGWAGYGRLIRGEVLKIKEMEYVTASKALGSRDRSVIVKHVIPNAMPPLLVLASLNIGTVVISIAALGFLGLGLSPETAEWGTMLDATLETIVQGPDGEIPWWATFYPGLAIFLFVMSMNMVGDGINDALDAQETGIRGQGG